MPAFKSGSLLHRSFRLSISLKGLHALLEAIGGILLLKVDPNAINRILWNILRQELSEDPRDFIATHLLRASHQFASGGRLFASMYLLSHGAVKVVLVIALLMNKLWAYPLMITVLATFIVYQVYRFSYSHSVSMILLTVFDVVVISLTWIEYQQQRSRRSAQTDRTL